MAHEISTTYRQFQKNNFIEDVVKKFPKLELKARISWISQCLRQYLPSDYKEAVGVILHSLPAPNNPELADGDFGDFIYASYSEFVAKNGCSKKDLTLSLNALYEITQRFSAEDAIRYFLNAFPAETMVCLKKWSLDDNYHVRRLCSEGTRPKLPWAQKINISIESFIPILDNLFFDKKRYVTRSVANHLNDISKINPDLAIKTLARFKKSQKQTSEELEYITRHALRSLVKIGNVEAMKMLGASCDANVEILNLKITKHVEINCALEFAFDIKAKDKACLIVDYAIYFRNKFGNLGGCKIFKLKKISVGINEVFAVSKRHFLRENMTTRKIFVGEHFLEIKINGKSYGKTPFLIIPKSLQS